MVKELKLLIASIAVCLLAGVIGSIFTTPSISGWYATLNKPSFNPPNWVFGPVWTTLYILMGIALYLVMLKGREKVKEQVAAFRLQLALNILWSIIFFGWHNLAVAFVEIIFLWLAIAATISLFWKVDKRAAYLLVPYILWVSFAAFLNYNIWMLNR